MNELKINPDRLQKRLKEMAEIGKTSKGGVCRLTLDQADQEARKLFSSWATSLGCTVSWDAAGNLFARKEGLNKNAPTIMLHSHLDSQPTGGKFDGVLGVLAGLEVLETIMDHDIPMTYAIEVVSWTNEEGARFAPAMLGSGYFAGIFEQEYVYSRTDAAGITFLEALEKSGYRGNDQPKRSYKACLELHIEQGPILERAGLSVGIVTGVQGIRWYQWTIVGSETHAGPTPNAFRKDPVKTFTALGTSLFELIHTYGQDTRITIGSIQAKPGVTNTVPGLLEFSLDIRHPEPQALHELHQEVLRLQQAHQQNGVDVKCKEIWVSPPVRFDTTCLNALRSASKKLHIPTLEMVSGAGHDSVYLSKIAPSAMIFIPCKDGLSHNEMEHAEPSDIEKGCNVLLHAVLDLFNPNHPL